MEPKDAGPELCQPSCFADALRHHMAGHGDTIGALHRAIAQDGAALSVATLFAWCRGSTSPRGPRSRAALQAIERRYRLPPGYFESRHTDRTPNQGKAEQVSISQSERRRLAWHLPADFERRSSRERDEILAWVRTVVISGATDYRRYQADAMKTRYALRFTGLSVRRSKGGLVPLDAARHSRLADAPERLRDEMGELLRFKTATLAERGLKRSGTWNAETAAQKVEHFALMFGALAADPDGDVQGFGADPATLSLALLAIPAVWDWYLSWRERRRGFFTKWEADMLAIALSLVRAETGWLRQTPSITAHLAPIPGLVSTVDVAAARADWDGTCETMYRHGRARIREIERVARVHRDPFEPILAVLEAESPVGEYRKITDEILRLMPNENLYPRAAAEAVRGFLMLRFGLHLGLRQRNLRELLLCPRGRMPTPERRLEELRRGELRWAPREGGWEVLIPSVAFKNANSSFFGRKPFRLVLPDLGGLYDRIDAWVGHHRAVLLGPAQDPGTFFVKTVKRISASAAYDQNTFYEAWRLTIQRYGIRNPYTGRGAIEGLLPHGPHNIRDVLATHILKRTGSYEQASYAIQDTPEMVMEHYGRFLPQDKAAIAARILNQVWEAA